VTDETTDVVRGIYAAWARGDLPGPEDLLDERIEYVNPAGAVEPGTRSGLSEFTRAVEKTFESWETWRACPQRMAVSGDRVAVLVHYRARGRESGVEIEGRESALWTIRAGRAVRYEWFHEPGEAFEALES
jgi:ketosteroid isomerase-like protein